MSVPWTASISPGPRRRPRRHPRRARLRGGRGPKAAQCRPSTRTRRTARSGGRPAMPRRQCVHAAHGRSCPVASPQKSAVRMKSSFVAIRCQSPLWRRVARVRRARPPRPPATYLHQVPNDDAVVLGPAEHVSIVVRQAALELVLGVGVASVPASGWVHGCARRAHWSRMRLRHRWPT